VDLRPVRNSTLIVVATVYGILLQIATQAGLFGFLLLCMVSLSLCRYGYAVLRDVARGRPRLPPPGPETTNPFTELSLALHFAFFALLAFLCATTPLLGDGWLAALVHYLGLGAVLAVYPASAAVMGITGSLAAAFNPQSSWTVIATLKGRYAALLGMCAVLALASSVTEAVVAATTGLFAPVLGVIVSTWAYLALFALIGTAIYAQRADFDLPAEIDVREDRDRQDRERVWRQALDRAYASIRSGFVDRGYGTIKELLASERDSLEIYQWVFNRMLDWQEPQHVLELGRRFVVRLVEEKREQHALELIDQCRRMQPSFAIPAEAASLSGYARAVGRPRLADELAGAAPTVTHVNPRPRSP
jgi:hypothetical protein